MTSTWSRLARTRAPALAFALVVAVGIAAFPFTVDDGYILGRYADRLSRGLGWTLGPGAATDGVTGPLGVVPGWVGALLGFDPVTVSKIIGLLCAGFSAALAARASSRHALGGPSSLLVAAFAGAGATLGVWSASGLETGLAVLAATVGALALVARPAPRGAWLGMAIAALAWLRPEAAVMCVAWLLACVARDRRQGTIALGLAAVGACSIVGFRLWLFGAPLPLSWEAKPAEPLRGLAYAARGLVVTTGLGGLVLAWFAASKSRVLRGLAYAIVAHVVAVIVCGGDWMPGFRLLAPVVPAYALLAGIGAARLAAVGTARQRPVAVALIVLGLGVPALDLVLQLPRVREAGAAREAVGRPLAADLARLAHGRAVALVDVGFLPRAGDFDAVDLGGVTDPSIGRRPGPHLAKRVEPEELVDRGVEVLVLRSFSEPRLDDEGWLTSFRGEPVEQRLALHPQTRRLFRVARVVRYSESYYYVICTRRDGP